MQRAGIIKRDNSFIKTDRESAADDDAQQLAAKQI